MLVCILCAVWYQRFWFAVSIILKCNSKQKLVKISLRLSRAVLTQLNTLWGIVTVWTVSYSLPVSEFVDINLGFCCWIYSSACKNDQSQKGALWFPFQPLKPLSEKFRGLLKILLSKTLHGVLFFIFHKVIQMYHFSAVAFNYLQTTNLYVISACKKILKSFSWLLITFRPQMI